MLSIKSTTLLQVVVHFVRTHVCVCHGERIDRWTTDHRSILSSDDGYRSMEQCVSFGGSFVLWGCGGPLPPFVALAHPSIASFPLYLNHEAGRTRPSLRCVEDYNQCVYINSNKQTNKHIHTSLHQYIYQSNLIAPCQ